MNKLLLALAIMTALSAPALASYQGAHNEMEARQSNRAYQHVSQMPRLRGYERQSYDPYWAPCDYTTDADPNGCE